MAEPLTSSPDPQTAQRLQAAATLAKRSTHYLRGNLHTILGFAEIVAEEDAERGGEEGFGELLTVAAQRLQARVDALLYVLAAAHLPSQSPHPEALGGLVQEVSLGRGVAIDCRFPGHLPVAINVQGLRCLLQEIAALRDAPPAVTLAIVPGESGAEHLEITCSDATEPPRAGTSTAAIEQPLGITVIAAVATALGGTLTTNESPAGGHDLRVAIPLPATHRPVAGKAGG